MSNLTADVLESFTNPAQVVTELPPSVRLVVTMAAQLAGFILLWLLGTNTFPLDQPNISEGLKYIQKVEMIYLAGSLAIPVFFFVISLKAFKQRFFQQHFWIDLVLLSYVGFDLSLLLFLICQQGGLCRSMFLPVFFLIPTAYMLAERRDPRYRVRRMFVLLVVMVCIYVSYRFAIWLTPQSAGDSEAVSGVFMLFWRYPIKVTDFSTLAHHSYDDAVLWASLISAFVPLAQLLVIMLKEEYNRLIEQKPASGAAASEP